MGPDGDVVQAIREAAAEVQAAGGSYKKHVKRQVSMLTTSTSSSSEHLQLRRAHTCPAGRVGVRTWSHDSGHPSDPSQAAGAAPTVVAAAAAPAGLAGAAATASRWSPWFDLPDRSDKDGLSVAERAFSCSSYLSCYSSNSSSYSSCSGSNRGSLEVPPGSKRGSFEVPVKSSCASRRDCGSVQAGDANSKGGGDVGAVTATAKVIPSKQRSERKFAGLGAVCAADNAGKGCCSEFGHGSKQQQGKQQGMDQGKRGSRNSTQQQEKHQLKKPQQEQGTVPLAVPACGCFGKLMGQGPKGPGRQRSFWQGIRGKSEERGQAHIVKAF